MKSTHISPLLVFLSVILNLMCVGPDTTTILVCSLWSRAHNWLLLLGVSLRLTRSHYTLWCADIEITPKCMFHCVPPFSDHLLALGTWFWLLVRCTHPPARCSRDLLPSYGSPWSPGFSTSALLTSIPSPALRTSHTISSRWFKGRCPVCVKWKDVLCGTWGSEVKAVSEGPWALHSQPQWGVASLMGWPRPRFVLSAAVQL